MFRFRMMLNALAFTVVSLALASIAQAQVPQTFVSAQQGNDANPCTVAAPCRTFTQALTQVQAGGVVTALDSGDYEPFDVRQSVTVQAAPGVYAGITNSLASAVSVGAGANDVVVLRGLTFIGTGGQQGQAVGFGSGKAVHVENCVIDGYSNGIQSNSSTSSAQLFVSDTTVRNCFYGIAINAGKATVEHSRVLKNIAGGLLAAAGTKVTVRDSVASGNGYGFRVFAGPAGSVTEMNIEDCFASDNGTGIRAESASGLTTLIRVANTTVTGNSTGIMVAGPGSNSIISRGDNTVEGNTNNGSFTGTFAAK